MYRSRPAGNLDSKALSYLSSITEDSDLFYYDLLGSQAHVVMLFESDILSKKETIEILKGIDQLMSNSTALNEYADSTAEDIHEMIESAVIKITTMNVGGKMHTARSRNDQVVLDIRMKLRDDLNRISSSLLGLIHSLLSRARENIETIMPMYTHLQQAQLGVLSHYLLSYCFSLLRNFERFSENYNRINVSPLGACAIGGSSMDIDRNKVASMLGFSGIVYNSVDATTSRDFLVEFSSNSLNTMLDLCRISEDFIIWSTSEFGFISLNDQYSSSSSAMPQKKNPDPLELIRGKTAMIEGNLVAISSIIKGLSSGYSRDLQEIKPLLWKTSSTLEASIEIMSGIVSTISVNQDRMYTASAKSYAISLDIAEQLIMEGGISFRLSHKVIGTIVDHASRHGNVPLSLLTVSDITNSLKKIEFSHEILTPEKILNLIKLNTPENSIKFRKTKGSPKKDEQKIMIDNIEKIIFDYEKELELRSNKLQQGIDLLNKKIKQLIN
ncbi:MAG TPA: argininosuccinate lyase [Candidatus Nitrosocosmicus sp.]|nr:argininosuccinate lyase [Candidatus Nitrosocosmicus sp.]